MPSYQDNQVEENKPQPEIPETRQQDGCPPSNRKHIQHDEYDRLQILSTSRFFWLVHITLIRPETFHPPRPAGPISAGADARAPPG